MEVKKFVIAGGNSTALVYGCPMRKRRLMVKNLGLKAEASIRFANLDNPMNRTATQA